MLTGNLVGRPTARPVTVTPCHIRSGTVQVARLARECVGGLHESAIRNCRLRCVESLPNSTLVDLRTKASGPCFNAINLPGSAVMNLLLKPVRANPGEFYVIADDQVVGRITPYAGAAAGLPWMWVLDSSYHAGREQTQGYAATRQDALLAFANSWHREV
jgi:hypothetical protein